MPEQPLRLLLCSRKSLTLKEPFSGTVANGPSHGHIPALGEKKAEAIGAVLGFSSAQTMAPPATPPGAFAPPGVAPLMLETTPRLITLDCLCKLHLPLLANSCLLFFTAFQGQMNTR